VSNALLEGKNWVFWLNQTHPGEVKGTFRVSIVIENESGHYPTGADGRDCRLPWYWDQETCEKANAERGFDKMKAFEVVASSMGASIREKGIK
jgi:hypothetical protein